jgi:hypothetical protein
MESADPLEFLKLSQGHELLKSSVVEQKMNLSDIKTEILVKDMMKIIT